MPSDKMGMNGFLHPITTITGIGTYVLIFLIWLALFAGLVIGLSKSADHDTPGAIINANVPGCLASSTPGVSGLTQCFEGGVTMAPTVAPTA